MKGRYTKRREFLKVVSGAGAVGLAGCTGLLGGGEGAYPSQEITVVIPFGSGGANDTQYRLFKAYFEEELGVSTVVENRTGAGGRTALNYLSNQDPDGYTLSLFDFAGGVLGSEVFDTQYSWDDLTHVAGLSTMYFSLATTAGRFEDVDDFVQSANEADEPISVGTIGTGTAAHLNALTMLSDLGVEDYRIVPYSGGAETASAIANGEVTVGNLITQGIAGLVEDGQATPLFVNRPERSPLLPDTPSVADRDEEMSIVGLENGLVAPSELADDRLGTLEDAVLAAAEVDEYGDEAEEQGIVVTPRSSDEMTARLDELQAIVSEFEDLLQE